MFDHLVSEPGALAALDDAALVTAMAECAAAESAAAARRLAVIAEFTCRRMRGAAHQDWACDDWDAASVEIGAALGISLGRASRQMDLGMTLRNRLPKVAALLAAGQLSLHVVMVIARRTDLVVGPDAAAALDAALAEHAAYWGMHSQARLEAAIDLWVTAVDPDAAHRTRSRSRDREIQLGDPNDGDGLTSLWGRLLGTDAKLLDTRLTAMARGVCDADPRTIAQRRADALGALAAGSTHLACMCGTPVCPAAGDDRRASSVTVHVVAESAALNEPPDPGCDGDHPERARMSVEEFAAKYQATQRASRTVGELGQADANPSAAAGTVTAPRHRAGLIVGGTVVPGPLLANLVAQGAKISRLKAPDEGAQNGYRPSATLSAWVRMRDLTCRAPGCDRPAVEADIDHTVPWPSGPTHPSNTKCYCRKHHLAKTFWPGFADRQNPDGTIEFATPTGHSYTTRPFSGLLFPAWATATATLPEPTAQPTPAVGQMMPKRKHTRIQQRRTRINTERALNAAENAPPF